MYLKKSLLVFVATVFAAIMANSAFADEYMNWTDKYFNSVKQYNRTVDEKRQLADQLYNEKERDLQAREQQLQQQQAAVAPPAGEFVPAPAMQSDVRLVYRSGYYPYNEGCVIVAGWFPYLWSWPNWWYLGTPPYWCPIYGRAYGGWDRQRRTVIVNNVTITNTTINRNDFQRDVRHAFGSPHKAPEFARKSPVYREAAGGQVSQPRQQLQTPRGSNVRPHEVRQMRAYERKNPSPPSPDQFGRQPRQNMPATRSQQQFPRQQIGPTTRQPAPQQNFGRGPMSQPQYRQVPAPRQQSQQMQAQPAPRSQSRMAPRKW